MMNAIKMEIDENNFSFENCFICLQSTQINEYSNSLKFFFNYLKIEDKINLVVCEKCGENLKKIGRLFTTLEKVRLEMDYLLGIIQSAILEPIKDFEKESVQFASVREAVSKKCKENIFYAKPEIILERVNPIINHSPQHLLEDWCPDLHDDYDKCESPAIPVKIKMMNIKMELDFQSSPVATFKRKRNRISKIINCTKCSKTFSRSEHLRRHVNNIHLRLKPFNCSICSRPFSEKYKLRNHINTVHPQLKSFKCNLCGKTFKSAANLSHHRATLHKPKPYTPDSNGLGCDVCKKMFASRSVLRRHTSSVHLKIRHYCQAPSCDRSYADQRKLSRHYKMKHPDLAVPGNSTNY